MILLTKTSLEHNSSKKNRYWAFALLVFFLFAGFEKIVSGQDSDFMTWTSVKIQTKIVPKLSFDLTQEFRLENNSTQWDEIFTNLNLAYSPFKFFEVEGSWRFIQHRKKNGDWIPLNRFHFDLKFGVDIKRFRPVYRFRFVRYPTFSNDTKIEVSILRHRLELNYDIRNLRLDPYVSIELFHAIEDDGNDEIIGIRYKMGADYRINKYHRIGISFRYDQEFNAKNPETHYILGLDYRWILKFKKKKDRELESS